MPRPTPPPLGLALTCLRSAKGWTQRQLAAAAGTAPAVICGYEKGSRQGLDRERLGELAAVMGLDDPAVELVLLVSEGISLASPATVAREEAAGVPAAVRRQARARALRVGFLVAGHTEAGLLQVARAHLAAEGQRRTARRWTELIALPPEERRLEIERWPELQSAAMCVRLCDESTRVAADDAQRALGLACLARRVAELASGEPAARTALLGYAWAFVANAQRVGAHLDAAEAAFSRALGLWRTGRPADPELLADWRMLDLEASLRRDQRRFDQAVELLDRARRLAPPEKVGRVLLARASVLEQGRRIDAAVEALREAAPLIEESAEPRLAWIVRFNLVTNLCHLGRYAEADALMREIGERTLSLGHELDLLRTLWLTGRVAAGCGRVDESRVALERAMREYAARGDDYDAALVALELSIVELEAERVHEVRRLAQSMLPVFERLGFHREALAALHIFCAAAQAGTATSGSVRHLLRRLERAREDQGLRFEEAL